MVTAQKNAGGCAGIDLDWSAAGRCGGTGRRPRRCRRPPPRRSRSRARPARRAIPAGGPVGPVGPKGDKGDTPNVRVSCTLAGDGKSITCTITAGTAELKGTARLQNTKRTVSRSGKGKVTLKLKSAKRLSKKQKVVVEVRSGALKEKKLTVKLTR